ncbi:hypothetical protein ACSDR0_05185 [Streptosporangium sp. G11]|uniref:hypothetical protein n=1 Tax=Streptosporangium sp. G11 TaxID=3436926 RepID=UPI003EB86E63
MSRRTSTVSIVVGILVTAVAMVAVRVLVPHNPGDLGDAVVVDRNRANETTETRGASPGAAEPGPSADPTAPDDPGTRDDRPSTGSVTSGEPGASRVTGRERAEPVKPPPPPRGGDDDDDDGGGDDGDD